MKKRNGYLTTIYTHRYRLALAGVFLLAVYFRFYQLGILPPGLHNSEVSSGLTALDILHKHISVSAVLKANPVNGLYSLLQVLAIKLLGNTVSALRTVSSLIGLVSVILTYLWVRSWFGRRAGLLAALFMAITPWTIGLSRLSFAATSVSLMIPATLWAATNAAKTKHWFWIIVTAILLGLNGLGINGLFFLLGLATLTIPGLLKLKSGEDKGLWKTVFITTGAGIVLALILLVVRFHNAKPKLSLNATSVQHAVSQISQTLVMFNVRGDNDFRYNIAGAPELNLFIGLMFLVGVLVCLIRFGRARYRVLLGLLVALFIPIAMQTDQVPNSLTALMAAPIVMALAAVGIVYMLDVWYGTFPVNSAARTLGTIPVILLLLISVYQGYKQYFVAWAGSPETYDVYNERARSMADYLNRTNFKGQRYVLVTGYDEQVVRYITYGHTNFTEITQSDIAKLPTTGDPKQISFITPQADDIVGQLKQHYPKARLSQHYSEFNDNNQIFAVYETQP